MGKDVIDLAKRNRGTTTKKIEKWINEGRGQGEGVNYKPWLTIQDVPSKGVVSREKGWKSRRIHHLMSQLEYKYFLTLEWSDSVIDIREQYPLLPIERTLEIAEFLGIKHPTDPTTQEPIVMTTDFMITVKDSDGIEKVKARTIKPVSQLKKREIEKFAIEQMFYKEQNIDWAIVTDKDIPEAFIENMEFIYKEKHLDNYQGVDDELVKRIEPRLIQELINTDDSLYLTALNLDELLGLREGSCLVMIKHLIANKVWKTNMNEKVDSLKRFNFVKNEA
jgi:hypothetical protein